MKLFLYWNLTILNFNNILDNAVHGHKNAKNQIERILGQWINGEKSGYCFGFEGPPGIGKTSMAKKGLHPEWHKTKVFCDGELILEVGTTKEELSVDDLMSKIKELNEMFKSGLISKEEFEILKGKLLKESSKKYQ